MPRVATPRTRHFPRLLLGWLWLAGAIAAREPDLADVWKNLADSQGGAAQAALKSLPANSDRARRLAVAVVKLGRQPVSEETVRSAEADLTAVAEGGDELAALAGYLRARLYQVHFRETNYARAAALYRELAQRQPQSHWARLGLMKLGMLTLFSLPGPADPVARLRAAEALLPAIAEPALQRDLNLQLAHAAVLYERPVGETLVYLKAVDAVGGLLGMVAEDVVIQLGEFSLRAGRLAESRAYFERVLRDFPTNNRSYNLTQKLAHIAELERGAAKGGGS